MISISRMLTGAAAATVLAVAAPALAQVTVAEPEVGAVRTVPAGGAVYETRQVFVTEGARLGRVLQLGSRTILRPDDVLTSVQTRAAFKVCAAPLQEPCLLDDDGDGRFDRWARAILGGGRALPSPAPYERVTVHVDDPQGFSTRMVFLGSTPDTLRLSYREFSSGYARPAFTEDLTFPLGTDFPQTVAVRDARIRIHRIDGEGMTYELLTAPARGGKPN